MDADGRMFEDPRCACVMIWHIEVQLIDRAMNARPAIAGRIVLSDLSQGHGILPANAGTHGSTAVCALEDRVHAQHHLQVRPRVFPDEARGSILAAPGMHDVATTVHVGGDVVDATAKDHPTVRGRAVRLQLGVGDRDRGRCGLICPAVPGRHLGLGTRELGRCAHPAPSGHCSAVRGAASQAACDHQLSVFRGFACASTGTRYRIQNVAKLRPIATSWHRYG